jgi:formate hydrogenlyase subunit 3/multisubunit Na+/H+ antiporter MnhD subunit
MEKVIIVLALLAILFALFRGLYYMVKDQGKTKRTVNSLTWRIALSVLLIVGLIIGVATGVIEPHGVQP